MSVQNERQEKERKDKKRKTDGEEVKPQKSTEKSEAKDETRNTEHAKENKTKTRKEEPRKGARQEKTDTNPKATPMMNDRIAKKAYEVIALAKKSKSLKLGANEVIKNLQKGDIELIFIAGNVKPFAIIEPIMYHCETKNRTFYFVPSAAALGKACELSRPVAACAIIYSENPAIRKLCSEIRETMSSLE